MIIELLISQDSNVKKVRSNGIKLYAFYLLQSSIIMTHYKAFYTNVKYCSNRSSDVYITPSLGVLALYTGPAIEYAANVSWSNICLFRRSNR